MKLMNKLKRITVAEKTGFRINLHPVILLDFRMEPFYDTTFLQNRPTAFNLPPGEYYVFSGRFTRMLSPIDFALEPLPKPERRNYENTDYFTIDFAENPYTGTIFWDDKAIVLDNSVKDLPIPSIVFIISHEEGHRYYITEEYCDIYAKNQMLKMGYNPSQIGLAAINTLSANNYHRKRGLIDSLLT